MDKNLENKDSESLSSRNMVFEPSINAKAARFPHCIVWTPLPIITWIIPFIGHMGICTSQGIIRDFAGPYYVSEDDMAFGQPTKYWQLDIDKVGAELWDRSVYEASEVYKGRMHNLCCDNCHSHVAMALNKMNYDFNDSWNMVKLCFLMLFYGKHVSCCGFLKTWLPFFLMVGAIVTVSFALHFTFKLWISEHGCSIHNKQTIQGRVLELFGYLLFHLKEMIAPHQYYCGMLWQCLFILYGYRYHDKRQKQRKK